MDKLEAVPVGVCRADSVEEKSLPICIRISMRLMHPEFEESGLINESIKRTV
jgi:hypothetical protein